MKNDQNNLRKTESGGRAAVFLKIIGAIVLFVLFFGAAAVEKAGANAIEEVAISNNSDVTLFYSLKQPSGSSAPVSASVAFGDFPLEAVRVTTIEESNIPLRFLFLVDVSKTALKSERDRVKAVIQEFVDNIPFRDRSLFQINTFGDQDSVYLNQTADPLQIIAAINKMDPLFIAETAYYPGAVFSALSDLKAKTDRNLEKFQIILVTDGTGYDYQLYTEKDMIIALQDAGVPLYVLCVFDTFSGTVDPENYARLSRIAESSGGAIASPHVNTLENWRLAKILTDSISGTYVITGKLPANFQPDRKNLYDVTLTLNGEAGTLGTQTKTVKPILISSEQPE